ncbi:hypothetical protein DAPPUDRAFT_60299 [Daphnia pulex]|uniref:Probable U2 small nuclear ribonucleoprotein A' n=1 Tax=Daphnia pulex TaxID=6669 RepID=E9HAB1_DAPPU|nr:hypothetical protein DAPPUDRAFT_60299 [Daphnia pulex]|eukprot:EFX71324.1 hypothetical protein DAPPUDRAFT_60299 [Daphnia pulex]
MVKLTAEVIHLSHQYTNAIKERELDLRGYKIPVIENLGATLDQFDTIDFSDNDIRKLDGFPLLRRIKSLLLNNNRILRIADGLGEVIPNLETLVLTNNHLQELGDLDPLAEFSKLTYLSLLSNPVANKQHYRSYVINKLPSLRVLDFRKVKLKEREAARDLFKSKKGKVLAKEIAQKSKFLSAEAGNKAPIGKNTNEARAIREAVANASTLEEVERLNQMLRAGVVPGKATQGSSKNGNANGKFTSCLQLPCFIC